MQKTYEWIQNKIEDDWQRYKNTFKRPPKRLLKDELKQKKKLDQRLPESQGKSDQNSG